MAIWSSGLGLLGFCSEMGLPALWNDCIKKCPYGVNREEFLRGLRRVIVFSTGPHSCWLLRIWKASPHPSPAHYPLEAPNNTYTTHLSSSRATHASQHPHPIHQIWQTYQLDTNQTPWHTHIHTKSQLYLQLITPHKDTTALTSYSFFPLLLQCRTPYAVIHGLVLLMMGIVMPKTCWDRSLIINIWLVASCWFLSLQTIYMRYFIYFINNTHPIALQDCTNATFKKDSLYIRSQERTLVVRKRTAATVVRG